MRIWDSIYHSRTGTCTRMGLFLCTYGPHPFSSFILSWLEALPVAILALMFYISYPYHTRGVATWRKVSEIDSTNLNNVVIGRGSAAIHSVNEIFVSYHYHSPLSDVNDEYRSHLPLPLPLTTTIMPLSSTCKHRFHVYADCKRLWEYAKGHK